MSILEDYEQEQQRARRHHHRRQQQTKNKQQQDNVSEEFSIVSDITHDEYDKFKQYQSQKKAAPPPEASGLLDKVLLQPLDKVLLQPIDKVILQPTNMILDKVTPAAFKTNKDDAPPCKFIKF